MTRAENQFEGERAAAGWRETDSGFPEEEGASRKWSEKAGGFRCCGEANMQGERDNELPVLSLQNLKFYAAGEEICVCKQENVSATQLLSAYLMYMEGRFMVWFIPPAGYKRLTSRYASSASFCIIESCYLALFDGSY